MFDEAIWRQPSIVLLDDLDHVVPAPSGPEAELSGEAIYGARIGEGMTIDEMHKPSFFFFLQGGRYMFMCKEERLQMLAF